MIKGILPIYLLGFLGSSIMQSCLHNFSTIYSESVSKRRNRSWNLFQAGPFSSGSSSCAGRRLKGLKDADPPPPPLPPEQWPQCSRVGRGIIGGSSSTTHFSQNQPSEIAMNRNLPEVSMFLVEAWDEIWSRRPSRAPRICYIRALNPELYILNLTPKP